MDDARNPFQPPRECPIVADHACRIRADSRTRWEILLKGSTLNRFLEEVRDAAVQVVPLGETG
jgi:hypothetical protein